MPTAIISTAVGQAARVTGKSVAAMRIQLGEDKDIGRFIVTDAAVRLRGAHQFLHAFDDTIYAHSYGNRIGELRVSGIAFFSLCDQGSEDNVAGTGLDDVVDFYERNKLGAKNVAVSVQLGSWFYRCMLIECNVGAAAGGQASLGNFTLQFAVLKYARQQ